MAILSRLATSGDWTPPCDDQCDGFIRIEHEGEVVVGECPMLEAVGCLVPANMERRRRYEIGSLGMFPRKYVKEASWDMCPARDVLRSWLSHRDPHRGLLLHGPPGTGKTMAATLLAMELWDVQQGRYVLWPRFVESLLNRDSAELVNAIHTPLLVVDDFGVGGWAEWVTGKIDTLFEVRQASELPTIVTTNLTPQTLRQEVGYRRFVDRWAEQMTAVAMPGPSMRGRE